MFPIVVSVSETPTGYNPRAAPGIPALLSESLPGDLAVAGQPAIMESIDTASYGSFWLYQFWFHHSPCPFWPCPFWFWP